MIGVVGFFLLAAIVLLVMHGRNEHTPHDAGLAAANLGAFVRWLIAMLPIGVVLAALVAFGFGYLLTGCVLLVVSMILFIVRERRSG